MKRELIYINREIVIKLRNGLLKHFVLIFHRAKGVLKRSYAIYVFYLVLFGCTNPAKISLEDLAVYAANEQNGLIKKSKVGDISVAVRFIPTAVIIAQELNAYDSSSIESLRQKYQEYAYFNLILSSSSGEVLANQGPEYNEILNRLSFALGDYVYATTALGDTISLFDSFFDNTYGMSSGNKVLMVFPKAKLLNSQWFQLHISELGLRTGAWKFRFATDQLARVPEVDFRSLTY